LEGVDKLVFLINQTAIKGRTRLQKYGFLACQLYRAELKPLGFYSDWEAYHYGPYSMDLAGDLHKAVRTGVVKIEPREIGGRAVDVYSLGPKGAKRLSHLMEAHGDLVNRIYETFASLNKKSLKKIIGEIYADYPQYAKNSRIKGEVTDVGSKDGACFSPEIERMVEEVESGNVDWEVQTAQEHIEYVKRLVRD